MSRRLTPPLLCAAILAALAPAAHAAQLQTAITGLREPTYVASEPGDASRLYAVERAGTVRLVRCGTTPEATPFLSLGAKVDRSYQEEGLLSLAFAPDYAASGLFYVAYTANAGAGNELVVEERKRSDADPFTADPDYARQIVRIPHPTYQNHNGGQLQFGPDGRLWLGTGDGGGANDPNGNAQNRSSRLGKMLRLDLTGGGAHEQWAYGLRNPWRFSFDRSTGDLIIGDVGQDAQEEIDFAPAPDRGREANYGWGVMEGDQGDPSGLQSYHPPAITHSHSSGWVSITGGYVVRDPSLPELSGRYVYADYGKGDLYSANLAAGQTVDTGLDADTVSSFGEDAIGRVYVVSLAGTIYRLVADGTGTTGAGGSDCGQTAATPGGTATGTPATGGRGLAALPGDTVAPVLRLRVARRQRALRRRAVIVRGSCDEACRLTVTARAGALRLRHRSATLRASRSFALRLTICPKARRSLRRSLRRGTRRTVVVAFGANDGSGNVRRRTLRIRVVG